MSSEFLAQAELDFQAILTAEFAQDITLTGSGDPVTVQGIFDETYQEVDPETGAIVMSSNPRVMLWASEIPAGFVQGSSVVVNGHTYKARTIEPDAQGIKVVKLNG